MTAGELLDAAHRFPFVQLREKLEDRPFIVVAPHPDDESLACGGLIADAYGQGLRGKVVIVSDGAGSHPNSKAYPSDRLTALREEEAKRAGVELGLKPDRPCGNSTTWGIERRGVGAAWEFERFWLCRLPDAT